MAGAAAVRWRTGRAGVPWAPRRGLLVLSPKGFVFPSGNGDLA